MRKTTATCGVEEFINHYLMLIFDYRTIQYGIFRAANYTRHNAMVTVGLSDLDVIPHEDMLIKLGALYEVPDGP